MTHAERNKKILEAIKEETERATVSEVIARKTLIDEGIYSKNGELMPEFGGKEKTAA